MALGSTQTRGRWGEIQLERILEFVGMEQGVDYSCQTTGEGGRPDVVVHLPGGKNVVIDSKAPFDAFERAANASSDEERTAALAEFARKVRQHVQELGRKGYWAHVTPSPDFTFMFLPGDAYLAAAEEQDAELFGFAYERGVLITTPRTIVVMLRDDPGRMAERKRVGARRRPSSRSRRSCTTGSAPWRTTWRRSAAGWTRPSAHTTRRSARTDHASSCRPDGSKGSRRHGSPLDDLAPLTEHASSQLQPLQLEVVPKDADAA